MSTVTRRPGCREPNQTRPTKSQHHDANRETRPHDSDQRMTIAGIPIADFTSTALLGFVFLLVLTDRLVWHKRLDKRDARIQTLEATVEKLTEQNGLMLKAALPTVDGVLKALHTAANEVDSP